MTCEHLVCASCSHPVAEGRCPVCREARSELHGHASAYPTMIAIALLVLAIAWLLTRQLGG